MDDRRQAIALFRYSLIQEAIDPELTSRQRGALVRQLAERDHIGPDGARIRVHRNTLDRWIRAWWAGGFQALLPANRTQGLRTPEVLLNLAVDLKLEAPERTATQIAAIIAEARVDAPSGRTLARHFRRLGLDRATRPPRAYGRFGAEVPNELWTGDALHGPTVAGRKTYLFAFIDDYSRTLVGYRWGYAEDALRLEAALRAGLSARGLPKRLYVDNGSAFVSRQLQRACAVLGIRLVHSRPGEPAGRGKIERVFGTVRRQFLVELAARDGAGDLGEVNRLFAAWVEGVYHRRVHTETDQPPLERFLAASPPKLPTPAELREAFLWAEKRQVTKTAQVSLHGNRYEVDPALVGLTVELVFDPFDLTVIEVRHQDRPMGVARPVQVGRHVHPQAKPEPIGAQPRPSGIDYLGLVESRLADQARRTIAYAALPLPAPEPAVASLDPTRHTIIYMANPIIGERGLYAHIVRALGGTPRFHKAGLVPQAAELLSAEEHERARTPVLILDEAHLLRGEQLEEVRMLTNHDMDIRSPFACLLLGQPTLRQRVKQGAMAALDQRIGLRYHVEGMDLEETASYVKHHLQLAGRSDPLFSDDAVALIHQTSRGIPRAVNNLAVQSLIATFADGKGMVDEAQARLAATEVTGT